MRFRRVMFGLIPQSFKDVDAEQEYISKFLRLVEYLGKLREKEDSESNIDIKIVSSADEKIYAEEEILKTRRPTTDSMLSFIVQLRKGKRDPFEWIEIAIESTFDTSSSYRIMFNWLVASSSKVEAQVQLLHRRCTQFGLHLISFPQATISRNLFLQPVRTEVRFCSMQSVDCNLNFFLFYSNALVCCPNPDLRQEKNKSGSSRRSIEGKRFYSRWYPVQ
jgi:hypothetical protein